MTIRHWAQSSRDMGKILQAEAADEIERRLTALESRTSPAPHASQSDSGAGLSDPCACGHERSEHISTSGCVVIMNRDAHDGGRYCRCIAFHGKAPAPSASAPAASRNIAEQLLSGDRAAFVAPGTQRPETLLMTERDARDVCAPAASDHAHADGGPHYVCPVCRGAVPGGKESPAHTALCAQVVADESATLRAAVARLTRERGGLSDVVAELQRVASADLTNERAAHAETRARLATVESALRPFAIAGEHVPAHIGDVELLADVPDHLHVEMTVRDLRNAAAALAPAAAGSAPNAERWGVWCVNDGAWCSGTIGTKAHAEAALPGWVSGYASEVDPARFRYELRALSTAPNAPGASEPQAAKGGEGGK